MSSFMLSCFLILLRANEWSLDLYYKQNCTICNGYLNAFRKVKKLYSNQTNISFNTHDCGKFYMYCNYYNVYGVPKIVLENSKMDKKYILKKYPSTFKILYSFVEKHTGIKLPNNVFRNATLISINQLLNIYCFLGKVVMIPTFYQNDNLSEKFQVLTEELPSELITPFYLTQKDTLLLLSQYGKYNLPPSVLLLFENTSCIINIENDFPTILNEIKEFTFRQVSLLKYYVINLLKSEGDLNIYLFSLIDSKNIGESRKIVNDYFFKTDNEILNELNDIEESMNYDGVTREICLKILLLRGILLTSELDKRKFG